MEAVILAGGKGTRLQRAVNDRPKPMADVNGRPFLEYLMDFLLKYSCPHIILSTCYMGDSIRKHFGSSYKNIPISYSEEDSPLGTGGAIFQSFEHVKTDKPTLIINGDTFFEIDLNQFATAFSESDWDVYIALLETLESDRYGKIVLNEFNEIKNKFSEKAKVGDLASGGFFMMSKSIKKLFRKNLKSFSFEEDFLPEICNNGARIGGMKFDTQFVDIGIPKDYKKFKNLALNFTK